MINKRSVLRETCLLCRSQSGATQGLCTQCYADLPRHDGNVCRCGLPFAELHRDATFAGHRSDTSQSDDSSHNDRDYALERLPPLCGRCLNKAPPFERILSPYRYQWPLDQLIPAYKYRGDLAIEHLLAQLWHPHPPSLTPHALVAIPLHWTRHWGRGFNQSLRLAHALSQHWRIPVVQALRRQKSTRQQKGLNARSRQHNVDHAFHCTSNVSGLRIAVIDDVVTTTSTVRAACQCLMDAGAEATQVLALARTV